MFSKELGAKLDKFHLLKTSVLSSLLERRKIN